MGRGETGWSKNKQKILEEIMAENFPKLMKNINPQIGEVQHTIIQINQRKQHISLSYSNF